MSASSSADQLRELLGPELVSDAATDLAAHSADWTPRSVLAVRAGQPGPSPDCVVRPESTAQVATLLEWADRTRTPVWPFGGGSGVCGGLRPEGGVVVDLGAMLKILDVDDKSRLVRVQAGVSGPQLAEVLGTGGWMLGQEPQSFAISTVGGWLATRACGQLSSRYGGIEDAVAALEVVLPGGRVLGGKTVPRRAAGPELWKLMIGSEGTLGIITDAVFRFSPVPAERVDRCLRFDHMADGVTACRSIAQSETHPTVVRLYDKEDSAIFLRNHPDQPEGPLLLLSFDGDDAEQRAERAVELAGGTRGDDGLVGHWWAHRNDAVAEFRKLMEGNGLLGPHGIVDTMEVSGTWSVLRELYHSMKNRLSSVADIVGCHLSHVYPDGACLYFTLASATADDTAAAVALDSWWDTGMRACLDAGGSISHHHGIGRLKAPWLAEELGGWWDMLKDLKKVIDPNRIMNPGALGL